MDKDVTSDIGECRTWPDVRRLLNVDWGEAFSVTHPCGYSSGVEGTALSSGLDSSVPRSECAALLGFRDRRLSIGTLWEWEPTRKRSRPPPCRGRRRSAPSSLADSRGTA
jgi:hypothetical protein